MKKITTFLILVLSISLTSFGQISNGHFEEFFSLPQTVGEFEKIKSWDNCGSAISSPDYFHMDGENGGDLPATPAAIVSPLSGKAIVGLTLYNSEGENEREYMATKLDEKLEVGKSYYVTFRLTNGAVTNTSFAGFGIDHIGVCFTEDRLIQNNMEPSDAVPQFEIDTMFYSRDWEFIHFSFTADKEYEYLTFGVFEEDDKLTLYKKYSNARLAYYFIDDFRMWDADLGVDDPEEPIETPVESTDLEVNPFFIPNSFTPNGDHENDTFMPIVNGKHEFSFEVYSRWGELLYSTSRPNAGWDGTYEGKEMPAEMYVWTIMYSDYNDKDEEVKQLHGNVNLMR